MCFDLIKATREFFPLNLKKKKSAIGKIPKFSNLISLKQ